MPLQQCRLIRWQAASKGFLLLNTDGYSKGNPGVSSGGKGVVRDEGGKVLLAFSCQFGWATSMQAEARDLHFGAAG